MPKKYKTSQKETIYRYLKNHSDQHISAINLYQALKEKQKKIGLTTVYRVLDQLVEDGMIKKFHLDHRQSACYQLIDGDCPLVEHAHFKCETCGQLIHFTCQQIDHFHEHMEAEHGLQVNTVKTVFYGLCDKCQ